MSAHVSYSSIWRMGHLVLFPRAAPNSCLKTRFLFAFGCMIWLICSLKQPVDIYETPSLKTKEPLRCYSESIGLCSRCGGNFSFLGVFLFKKNMENYKQQLESKELRFTLLVQGKVETVQTGGSGSTSVTAPSLCHLIMVDN